MDRADVVVIGAGQSGLAAAHALLREGLRPVVLEASDRAAGSWPRYYDSLTLFSPARYSSLPGMPFPGTDPDRYPHRDEVVAYLTAYADQLDADIRTGQRVTGVRRVRTGFEVELQDGRLATHAVVAASGTFGRPHRPVLPGLDGFTGTVLHTAQYRSPEPFTGQRIVVVGAGNSAVQIATELARTATVTLASRNAVRFAAQHILGRDLHFWLERTGLDIAPLGRLVRTPPTQLVIDDGRYRTALAAGRPDRRPLFIGADGAKLLWPDGTREGGWTPSCWPPATARICRTLPVSTVLATARATRGTARASPQACRVWRSSGWSGSAACRRARCAEWAGTLPASPAAWPPVSRAGDGPRPSGSTCVNIDACRTPRCFRCSIPPTARAWCRAARR
ncbi:flavin-containing monooxygenase [Streptomyces sp. NPDC056291]|uniref:flavin-containing monooxygenase n=1 Tax=unclassified Streptomyces TaxID=2593676 RepID=UPI0035D656F4